ncbi:hypothetical protein [Bdellovibrio bacteriovorus]|uniref:hypothetical protein n=1 Tax=Bdellovibrio bacteriovorus TaxID=959 RepID=UPI0035A5E8FF
MKALVLLSCFLCVACSETVSDRIGDAQLCLDNATPEQAQGCIADIESVDRADAHVLKCAAGFVTEGFGTGDRFRRSFRQLDENGDGTPGLLGYLAFASQGTPNLNRAFALKTDIACQKSEQKSMRLFGSLALAATTIAELGGLTWDSQTPPTAADIRTAITTMENSGSANIISAIQQIGMAVVNVYNRACSSGNVPNKKLCEQHQNAVTEGQGDLEQIGRKILDKWKNNSN